MKESMKEAKFSSKELVFLAANAADDKKAINTQIIDIRTVTDVADYLMVTSGDNPAQLKAIASEIEDQLSKMGQEPAHKEGKHGDKWFLFDYGDVVIHIIGTDAREYYKLEEFWSHAMLVNKDEWLKVA